MPLSRDSTISDPLRLQPVQEEEATAVVMEDLSSSTSSLSLTASVSQGSVSSGDRSSSLALNKKCKRGSDSIHNARYKTHTPLSPKKDLHGSTSRVVLRQDTWNWNTLPKVGSTIFSQIHSFNVINIPIDGQYKQILYDPHYNKNFKAFHLFIAFNSGSVVSDAILFAKKRLHAYTKFLTKYWKARKYAFDVYPFQLRVVYIKEVKFIDYESFIFGEDYSEIENLLHLWIIQAQRLLVQSNSIFFSNEIVEQLLRRKSECRESAIPEKKPMRFVEEMADDDYVQERISSEKSNSCSGSFDILLIRPLFLTQLGWQLAHDEPALNIADYPLDISPWMADDHERETVLKVHDQVPEYLATLQIVDSEDDVTILSSETAADILVDCMDRKVTKENFRTSGDSKNSIIEGNDKYLRVTHLHHDEQESSSSSKAPSPSPSPLKKASLANLFKRKHSHAISSLSASSSPNTSSEALHNVHKGTQVKQDTLRTSTQSSYSISNTLLEDYFSSQLGNYRKVQLPTQYILPKEFKSQHDAVSTDAPLSAALTYGRDRLQLKLPFPNDSVPAVFCPWFWAGLSYDKWKYVLNEVLRCVTPGGYALAFTYDLRTWTDVDNDVETKDSDYRFGTTIERDNALDELTITTMSKGLATYPTEKLADAFKEAGFTNVKSTILSFPSGDLVGDMDYLTCFLSMVNWDVFFRKHLDNNGQFMGETDAPTFYERYIKERLDKRDPHGGCERASFVIAQRPRRPSV